MKKGLTVLLAVLLLAAMLTACAATQPYYDGYSNVSTTHNGYVNGTNDAHSRTHDPYDPAYVPSPQTGTRRTVTERTTGTAFGETVR